MRALLPAAAPATAGETRIAEASLWWRLARALVASAVMLATIFAAAAWEADVPLPDVPALGPRLVRNLAVQLVLLGVVIALAHRIVGLRNVGLRRAGATTSCVMMLPILGLSLMDGNGVSIDDVPKAAALIVLAILVGLTEEIYARGFLVTLLGGRRHAALAIVGSSVLFAYLHVPVYAARYGWAEALLRSTASAAFSAAAAITVLRSGSIVGPLVFHAINDAQMLLGGPTAGDVDGAHELDFRPLVSGVVVAVLYWLAARRGIRAAAVADATARPR